ncbi:sulfotransferase [Gloeocapsa sp. PCC 73106]|uniref:sulfotransferase family protein n=1 Tax=Gloeocapsa sp. PCC 73106 TaxID=102232 RepID=UPI0002ACD9A0|nr:sulfotransferase [Gloeocapsa sp. PCC 73106]ELR99468.1 sulfotransferase family protein [Gloeocapsa sp. PCC 73106]
MYFNHQLFWKAVKTSFSPQYFHPLHAFYVIIFASSFLLLRSIVSLVREVERFFYPHYRQQLITNPIYITGNPRSGTTFLHRLLCEDPQFTYTKLYHTIFPSISFYYLFDKLEKLNHRFNGLFTPIVNSLEQKGFKGWEKIHTTKLNEAEEDEQFFVFTMLSPVITLLFPFYEELTECCWVDKLPLSTREDLMSHYRDCLQRHLYGMGGDRTLLTKNTTCTGRLEAMIATFPDLKIIHIIRHPYESIPSLLSMYNASWRSFVPQTHHSSDASKALAQLYADYYRQRLRIFQELSQHHSDRLLEIRYEDLIADPLVIIKQIYAQFQIPLTEQTLSNFQTQIKAAQTNYRSKHYYSLEQFGLSKEMIYASMKDVFDYYQFQP